MTELRIAADLALPIEAVTQTFAILAKRGVGKTYTALVLVEELLKARLQVVVADPIGVCWGLRASADGKTPGLPIAVLGGDHGDVPLDETAGQVVADLLVDERLSAVLDLSLLRKGQQVRFMTDFSERLYHRNRSPLQLVLDEADAFAPQRPMKGQERMLGAVEDLVRRGRARGIGVTLVTQRAAVLNKDVLTQVEVLVALRTIAPQDRAAIDEWIRVHGTPEQREELMRSLPSLPIGEAWFWSPGWLDLFQRVHVRPRETFDSSATPKVGQKLQAPKTLADVDLEALRARLANTIEQARSNDPRALHARIRELERALAAKAATGEIAAAPVIDQAAVDRAADAARRPLYTRMAEAATALDGLAGILERAAGDLRRVQDLLQLSVPAATVRDPSPHVATVAPLPRPHARRPPRAAPGTDLGGRRGSARRSGASWTRWPRSTSSAPVPPTGQRSARWRGIRGRVDAIRTCSEASGAASCSATRQTGPWR